MKWLAGISIALLLPILFNLVILPLLKVKLGEETSDYLGIAAMWAITLLLAFYIRIFENVKLSLYGFKSLSVKMILIATGLGILLSLFIPLFYSGVSFLFEHNSGLQTIEEKSSILVLAGVITAAFTEEILFRGYPLEKLKKYKWWGPVSSVVAFTLAHAQNWSILHILGIVLPLGIILTIAYIKTRNIFFVMIIHLMIDIPLFFVSLMK